MQKSIDNVKNEWSEVPFTTRFIWLLGTIMIVSAYSIFVRPDNRVADHILARFGFEPTFVSFSLFVSGILIIVGYGFSRNLSMVTVFCLPGILWFVSLVIQVGQSPSEPIMHLVTAGSLIASIIFTFRLTGHLDRLERENQKLFEANQAFLDKPGDKE